MSGSNGELLTDADVAAGMDAASENRQLARQPVGNAVQFRGGKPVIDSSDDLKAYARIIWETPSMEISGARGAADVFMALAHGMEAGLSPTMCVRNVMVVNGKPAIWGDCLLGLIQRSGQLAGFTESFDDETTTATCRILRLMPLADGSFREIETIRTFSKADAEAATLWGKRGPWSQYPKRMLQHRARGFALRDAFADHLGGLSVMEDVRDGTFDPSQMKANQQGSASRMLEAEGDGDE